MAKEIVRIVDLVSDHERPVIEGEVFEDKEIQGPAVLLNLGDCAFEQCNFRGAEDQVFLEMPKGKEQIGVIGLRSVKFIRCEFSGIGLIKTPGEGEGTDNQEWAQTG